MGFLIFNPQGLELSSEEKQYFSHPYCYGAILFSKNYQDIAQLKQLIQSIKKINPQLRISVDHEGGRVQRFRQSFSELPSAADCARDYEKNPEKIRALCYQIGVTMAQELKPLGIDINFAPVLDLDYGKSAIISSRSFHHNPEIVIDCASALMQGMQQGGIVPCGKHFPGHGAVTADSHQELPLDQRDFETINQADLLPFRRLSEQLPAIMSAHVIYAACDAMPATFSSFWLREILRQQLRFSGKIFSDDLNMQAAQVYGNALRRAELALEAGCDVILLCHDLVGVGSILNESALKCFIARGQHANT